MIGLPSSVKIFIATEPTDMRRGFDGLSAIVRYWGEDVFSGHLFVFISRRGDRAKILTWDNGGFVLFYKRLEKGRFHMPWGGGRQPKIQVDSGQLAMLLEGIDVKKVKMPKKWTPSPQKGLLAIDKNIQL